MRHGRFSKVAVAATTMMVTGASLFAQTTTGASDDVITTTLDKIAGILSGPIIGALFIGIFAVKMLIAYTKHQSHPEDMKKEVITALIFAAVIVGAVTFITWLLTGAGADSSSTGIAGAFTDGIKGAVISPEYAAQAAAMLTAGL